MAISIIMLALMHAAGHSGGGVHNAGMMIVSGCTISGNSAIYGGGIDNRGKLSIEGTSQITGNKATTGYGGRIYSSNLSMILSGTEVVI